MSKSIGNGKYGLRVIFTHPSMKDDKDRDTTFWFNSEEVREKAFAERTRRLNILGSYVIITKLKRK